MPTVNSADGTRIVYEQAGRGPALILVGGAMTTRDSPGMTALAERLAPHFTVIRYDRRARGESDDRATGQPPAVAPEIADLEALLAPAGGTAFLYGHSSGAALALEAAAALGASVVPAVALYEAPYSDDPAAQVASREYVRELATLLGEQRHADAVALFVASTGAPPEQVEAMRADPSFGELAKLGPSLAYDHIALLDDGGVIPRDVAERISVPALVMAGEATYPFMLDTARQLAALLPRGELRLLPAETHDVRPEALASVLIDFFAATTAGQRAGASG